ncbi:MAG: hypothetical protein RLY78_787 [Pseudomonadota bacterium]|jgi:hypothetical protein
MSLSELGFVVRPLRDAPDLRAVRELRAEAYGHHDPLLAQRVAQADAADLEPGCCVLMACDKVDGRLLGTLRLQRGHPRPLPLEHSVRLPEALRAHTRAELTRLAVRRGVDPMVRLMLFKAAWLHALATQVRQLVITARSPALIRLYHQLGFEEVWSADHWWPMAHVGGLPHRVLSFEIPGAERRWHDGAHPLHPLFVQTCHPDLDLLPPAVPVPARPRVPPPPPRPRVQLA